jgi:hypothetical protein
MHTNVEDYKQNEPNTSGIHNIINDNACVCPCEWQNRSQDWQQIQSAKDKLSGKHFALY